MSPYMSPSMSPSMSLFICPYTCLGTWWRREERSGFPTASKRVRLMPGLMRIATGMPSAPACDVFVCVLICVHTCVLHVPMYVSTFVSVCVSLYVLICPYMSILPPACRRRLPEMRLYVSLHVSLHVSMYVSLHVPLYVSLYVSLIFVFVSLLTCPYCGVALCHEKKKEKKCMYVPGGGDTARHLTHPLLFCTFFSCTFFLFLFSLFFLVPGGGDTARHLTLLTECHRETCSPAPPRPPMGTHIRTYICKDIYSVIERLALPHLLVLLWGHI
jgi:hypothetical protein